MLLVCAGGGEGAPRLACADSVVVLVDPHAAPLPARLAAHNARGQ